MRVVGYDRYQGFVSLISGIYEEQSYKSVLLEGYPTLLENYIGEYCLF